MRRIETASEFRGVDDELAHAERALREAQTKVDRLRVRQAIARGKRARISVRRSTYRRRPGWLISGRDHFGRSVKIFDEDKTVARQIADAIKRGEYDQISPLLQREL